MNRMTSLAAGLVLTTASLTFTQQTQPTSHTQDALPAQRLVAWTWMQEPQPATIQLFIGRIVRVGSAYVLKIPGNTTFQVDEQMHAKQYENQEVRLIGSLETGSNTIRVMKMDLLFQSQSLHETR